ncbi:MAG: hypothetical protein LBT33_10505, partial [Spirochaetia bacterium]|nr:hypothetical protein [Spirochaetia bacterium]
MQHVPVAPKQGQCGAAGNHGCSAPYGKIIDIFHDPLMIYRMREGFQEEGAAQGIGVYFFSVILVELAHFFAAGPQKNRAFRSNSSACLRQ